MAFTGKATIDGYSDEIQREIGRIIADISPTETPFLDFIGDAYEPVTNPKVEWLNDALAPLTVNCSKTISSSSGDTTLMIHNSRGEQLPIGTVLYNYTSGEHLQVNTTNPTTLGVTRGFGASTAATVTAGHVLQVIGPAGLEGRDWNKDTSSTRDSDCNYIELIFQDVAATKRKRAVANIGVIDELDYQTARKTIECLRNLERKLLIGRSAGNTIGSATAPSMIQGLKWFVNSEYSTHIMSLGTMSRTQLDGMLKYAWDVGADDIDAVFMGPTIKEEYDADILGIQRATLQEDRVKQEIQVHESKWMNRPVRIYLCRSLPPADCVAVASRRVKIVHLKGNFFQTKEIAPTGLTDKRMVWGEYTGKFKNPEGFVWMTRYTTT